MEVVTWFFYRNGWHRGTQGAGLPGRVPKGPVQLQTLFSEYARYLRSLSRDSATIQRRIGDLRRLARRLPDLAAATVEDLESYLEEHRELWSAWHLKQTTATFRSFFGWLTFTRDLKINPAERLPSVPVPHSIPRPIPDDPALLRLAEHILIEQHDEWDSADRRYFSDASMALLNTTGEEDNIPELDAA